MIFIIGSVVLGLLIADFFSGVLHFVEDQQLLPDYEWINKEIIEPNLLHHEKPMAFTEGSFWFRNNSTIFAASAVAAPLLLLFGPQLWLLVAWFVGAMTNQIHYYAHTRATAPQAIKIMQDMGVLQHRSQHNRHHKYPHDSNFCIVTNWLNPILDTAGFWKAIIKLTSEKTA